MQAASKFKSRRKHHLHRKTQVLPCELAQASNRLRDLSVGPTMFFSRRWMLCRRQRSIRTACLNCCRRIKASYWVSAQI